MKKLLSILVILLFVCAVFAATVQAESQTDSRENEPGVTMSMAPIFTKLDFIVNIPDPNLKAALHKETGVPTSDPIVSGDLKALTGELSIGHLGIANIEGVQYCENITSLYLNENYISALPNMSRLTNLKTLSLEDNNFTSVPAEVGTMPKLEYLNMINNPISEVDPVVAHMLNLETLSLSRCALTAFPVEVLNPNLEVLRLSGNNLGSVPSEISSLTSLRSLSLHDTGLSTLPSSIYNMTWLEGLYVTNNKLTDIPAAIANMTGLKYLQVSYNRLDHLPDEICNMTSLNVLRANGNRLSALPENIGMCTIGNLDASNNSITALPETIGDGNLHALFVSINRLTSLPSSFGNNSYTSCYIDYNFIDISPGSPDRIIIDSLPQDQFAWQPQLMPITNLTATPTDTDITLSWDACIGGSDIGFGSIQTDWSVVSYSVYHNENGLVQLAELTPGQTTYTHSGLAPEQSHTYRLGVTYHFTYPSTSGHPTFQTGYTEITVSTLPTPTTPPTAPPTATPSVAQPQSEAHANEEQVNGSAANGKPQPNALPAWAIVLISFAGTGALVTGGWFGWRMLKKLRAPKP